MPSLIEKWRADPSLRLECPSCRQEILATLWSGDEVLCCRCNLWLRLEGRELVAHDAVGVKITQRRQPARAPARPAAP